MSTHRLYIDPGFTYMGWASFSDAQLTDHGTTGIERAGNEPWLSLLNRGVLHFREWFHQITQLISVDEVVFEVLSPVAPGPQVPLVFSAIATIKTLAYEDDIPIRDISAHTWKKALHGKAKGVTKVATRNQVLEVFPEARRDRKLTDIRADETDAIAIGIADRRMYATTKA